jgi:lysozyme family protein
MNFEKTIDDIVAREKGYVNDPADSGGETNYGIAKAVARANGFAGDMRDLPIALAREIYRKRYITEPQFHLVADLSAAIAAELVDTGVNMGPGQAALFLQRWLNAFNLNGSQYGDLFVDGRIGGVTLAALRAYLDWRGAQGETVMVAALNSVQGARYLDITEAAPKNERFAYGWIFQRVAKGASE